jgi:8-oxo-dGTP pyrophosphatase MutT (NUDIX family)
MDIPKKDQSVAGIIFRNGFSEVLLIKRRDVPVWVLPGGGIEEGENLAEAIIREMIEETGFYVKIKRKVAEFHPINKLTQLTHLYECEITGGSATTGSETSDIQFFSIEALPKLMPPPYQEWIRDAALNLDRPLIKHTQSATYWVLILKLLKHPILVLKYFFKKWKLSLLSS